MGEHDVERLRDDALAYVRTLIVEPRTLPVRDSGLGVAPQWTASAVVTLRQ
jgi:hypothetical protein